MASRILTPETAYNADYKESAAGKRAEKRQGTMFHPVLRLS
jgi:hypothetical protein